MEKNINRRNFLKLSGATSAVLALGIYFPANSKEALIENLTTKSLELSPFIIIDTAGKITLINPRPDMGQGTFHSIPLLIAEELEVDINKIEIKPSDGTPKYGGQLSGGSGSVRASWLPMRKAGASAKEMLIKAAANRWQVSENECYAQDGKVFNKKNNTSLSYGELVEEAAKLEVPKEPKLKEKKDFRYLGKKTKRVDIPSKVDGSAIFGMDLKIPNMVYAVIEHCPAIWGKVASIDDSETRKVAGVKDVIKITRPVFMKQPECVAVIANSTYAAMQGRKALKVTWESAEAEKFNSADYFKKMRELAKTEGNPHETEGDVKTALAKANKVITAEYETPFASHAPMETEACVVHVKEDSCEIWAPIQSPDTSAFGVGGQVAMAVGMKPEQVKVNVVFMGGAFGRKAFYDFVVQAALLSKQLKAPVKVVWTREDDITQGPFRPAMLNAFKGGIDKNGNVIAFQHTIIGGSIQSQWGGMANGKKVDEWAVEAVDKENSPYEIPNFRLDYHHAEPSVPLLWWRSVYSSTNGFGHESFIDELAHAAKKDPMDFRIGLLEKAPRFKKVLETLKEKSKWTEKLPKGKARGVAIIRSFGTICAHVVTVAQKGKEIVVEKVVTVIDCGMTVSPDNVKAQTEGNIVMGLTAAVKDGITFVNGKAQQSNFHNYQMIRIQETPKMEIHIMENDEQPSGVGEPGLPPLAPALANAIFALTGKRIRTLPLKLEV
ncbi:molybdopterin cofactor-binding domain-containing protein [Thermoflexibacter ruber]|uniref:Isoquinoline 1-oxidoreductase, beta subunit n=1 Tax=Thermoflexibacter ruber TaxID=1003 RepID=A0A1I2GWT8_9BACT|nr:molybdopterin cofactor-binding domain-containing protein [Thermoflexibacter ruber]SFF21623.1 isoquinoline 1-oxidoreductase, beta subunit [Thermoflexibacter ruber]